MRPHKQNPPDAAERANAWQRRRIPLPWPAAHGCFCDRNVTDKLPAQRVSAGLWIPRPPRFIHVWTEARSLDTKTAGRLRALHTSLQGRGSSFSSREVGEGRKRGVRPRPDLPPEPAGPLPDGRRTRGFPGDQVPFKWRTAVSFWGGLGSRPSFFSFQRTVSPLPSPPRAAAREREPPPIRGRVRRRGESARRSRLCQ